MKPRDLLVCLVVISGIGIIVGIVFIHSKKDKYTSGNPDELYGCCSYDKNKPNSPLCGLAYAEGVCTNNSDLAGWAKCQTSNGDLNPVCFDKGTGCICNGWPCKGGGTGVCNCKDTNLTSGSGCKKCRDGYEFNKLSDGTIDWDHKPCKQKTIKHNYNCIQTFPEKDVVPCEETKCVSDGGIKRSCVIDDDNGTYASLGACQKQCVATEGQTCSENPKDDEWCADCSTGVFSENCDEVCASFNRTQYAVDDYSDAYMRISDHTTGVEGSLQSWKESPTMGCWIAGCSCFPKSSSGSKFNAGL